LTAVADLAQFLLRAGLRVLASYAMDDHSDACMAEPEPPEIAEGAGSNGQAADGMLTGGSGMPVGNDEEPVKGTQQRHQPGANARRTEWVRVISRSCAGSLEDERSGQEEEVGVATDVSYTLDTLSDPEAVSVLKDLAVAMFVIGPEASVAFGALEQLAGSQNVRIWKLVKQAIHSVYESKQHRGSICRSPERPDLRLSQEEANGYLAGAVFGVELLASEARAVGKNVDNCVAAERKAAASKEPFKTQRRRAREAAAKDLSLTEALEATLADIQAAEDAAKTARLGRLYPIELPAAQTVIVEPRPPTEAEAEQSAATKLRWLKAAAAEAAEAAAEAEAEAALAAQEAERAEKSLARLGPCPTIPYLLGCDLPRVRVNGKLVQQSLPEGEREYRDAQFECWALTQRVAHELRSDAHNAARAARDARAKAPEAAEEAVTARELEDRCAQTEAAAAAATAKLAALKAAHAKQEEEWAAEDAATAEERMRVQTASVTARAAALEGRRQEIIAQWGYDPCSVRCETPAETRARLEAGARLAQAAAPVKTPPKVISLVGMSPDSVRTVGESRAISQQLTGMEERVRLNCLLADAMQL